MPSINGIDFNNIISIKGVPWSSVTDILGISVSHGISCDSISLGYSDGKKLPPEASCTSDFFNYDFDSLNSILYLDRQCGSGIAPVGYYSDGRTIFYFDGFSFTPFGSCRR